MIYETGDPMMRLDRFLSEAGVSARKEIKQMVKSGRVQVNGTPAAKPELKIDENRDVITVDGSQVRLQGRIVLMLYKPAGVVTSTEDPRDRTVMDLLPAEYKELFPVGRLDKDTEGLLLLTNDGDLGHVLTSPKHHVEKEYYAETEGTIDDADIRAFADGIVLRDGTNCQPAGLSRTEGGCLVVLHEGKYHQVRRMLASRGKPVTYLKRIREGGLVLDITEPGTFRLLSDAEIEKLL